MKTNLTNSTLTIFLEGKITSNNSETVANDINVIRNSNIYSQLILDLENLDYTSSAGLRVILNLSKAEKSLKIINVNPEVYDIFDTTGFTQILNIEKSLKEISIEGKELIGQGYIGKVYRIDPETIIKVNYRVTSPESIKRERELAKKAFILGIPTAISYDVVKVKEGGFGSMFELITDDSLCGLLVKYPEKTDDYINIYTDLLYKITSTEDFSNTLPSKKEFALSWVNDLKKYDVYSKDILEKMENLINEIPETNNLVHGDFHIKNVMMQNGEALLIDMDTLGIGHKIFELTPMFLTYVGYPSTEPGNLQKFLGISDEQGDKLFNRSLEKLLPNKSEDYIKEVKDKCALLGYMWLTLKTLIFEPENAVRLEHSKNQVEVLLKTVKTLNF